MGDALTAWEIKENLNLSPRKGVLDTKFSTGCIQSLFKFMVTLPENSVVENEQGEDSPEGIRRLRLEIIKNQENKQKSDL